MHDIWSVVSNPTSKILLYYRSFVCVWQKVIKKSLFEYSINNTEDIRLQNKTNSPLQVAKFSIISFSEKKPWDLVKTGQNRHLDGGDGGERKKQIFSKLNIFVKIVFILLIVQQCKLIYFFVLVNVYLYWSQILFCGRSQFGFLI